MKIIEKNLVFENEKWKIRSNTYEKASGERSEKLVMYPRNPISTMIFPITKDGKIILIEEYKHGQGKYLISCAGGTGEDGESIEKTARRELLEETGYSVGKLEFAGEVIHNKYIEGLVYLYIGYDAKDSGITNHQDSEDIKILTFSPKELEDLIKGNKINDSWAITLFYRAKELTNNFTDI